MKGLGKCYKKSCNGSLLYKLEVSKKLNYQNKVRTYVKNFSVFRVFHHKKSIEMEKYYHIRVEVTYFRSR